MDTLITQITEDFDVKHFLNTLTQHPGVYQMVNAENEVIYVGKARNLKKRVTSYFRTTNQSIKTTRMMESVQEVRIIITDSENAALILESNLIKELKPRYNILLRDDKSYPYLYLYTDTDFPRFDFYRGTRKEKGRYFGPYPSSTSVRSTLNLIQKLFKIRQCQDTFFANRTRPCMQYQIKRCTAPCVGLIDKESYSEDVRHAALFLEGKNQEVTAELNKRMEVAAEQLDYETAAKYRDQIASLQRVQTQQYMDKNIEDTDVIAIVKQSLLFCINVIYIRGGRVLGSKNFFPKVNDEDEASQIIEAFIGQYYLNTQHIQDIPKHILLNIEIAESAWLSSTLQERAEHKVDMATRVRGDRARLIQMAEQNATQALQVHLAKQATISKRLEALQTILSMDHIPQRIECFDVSHNMGEATVASCVVFGIQGALRNQYRRFNIKDVTMSDDYAAMRQALWRRYKRQKEQGAELPDILLIDGGKGQLTQAKSVLEELQITDMIIIGISKGPTRKAGWEKIWLQELYKDPVSLELNETALHLLQEVRDEAHRFAIMGHRQQRAKKRQGSTLEQIPGIGAKKRRDLLQRFGGWQAIKGASVEELAKTPGISKALATLIWNYFR